MKNIRKFLDFYIYSSIHIALGAALSVVLCYAALTHIPTSDYPIFVFCSTVFLYCIHRIVGINKVKAFEKEGRFAIIKKFRIHIILYSILGGIASVYFYLGLPRQLQYLILIPALLSGLYVLPLFSGKKRLRDFSMLKIYLIVLNWALVIGIIPYIEVFGKLDMNGILYGAEKALFIFAITLPFDVRDLEVDKSNNVSTIPSKVGAKKTYNLAYLLISLAMLMVACLSYAQVYTRNVGMGLIIGYLLTFSVIRISRNKVDDYYFSGLLDGMIALLALLGIFLSGILDVLF